MSVVKDSQNRPSVKALERGLAVLDHLFTVSEERLHEIAEKTNTPPSTLHRLLTVLQAHGYVSASHGVYQLGTKGLWLTSLREPIRQILQDLAREVGETANFAVVVQGDMEFLERAVSDHPLSFVVSVGSRVPLHCSALGKAVLAFRSELLDDLTFEGMTSKSITDPVELKADLEVVRHRGFSLDDEEYLEGVYCVAVPVFGRTQQAVGAVSVSGPVVRFSRDKAFQVAQRLKDAGDRISRLLQ